LAIADDAQLVKLAAHRARDLFPILKRARALTPLLLLFAVLPGLPGLTRFNFTENDALWGLKSLNAFTSSEMKFIDPGRPESAGIFKTQAPLGSWLSVSVISLVGTSSPYALTFVSFLSAAGLIIMSFILMQTLYGPRAGFLTALILAFHGSLLELSGTPAPHALSLLLAVVSFWGIVEHLKKTASLVSFPLLIAGIALGLCFLSGGPWAFAVILVLLAYVLAFQKNVINGKTNQRIARRRAWSGWIALRSLCIAMLTAFAIAGWWFLMMWSQDGLNIFSDWFTRTSYDNISANIQKKSIMPATFVGYAVQQIVSILELVVGLTLLGFWRACREIFKGTDEQKRHGCLFLVAWTGIAACLLLGLLWESHGTADHLALYKGFLLIPSVALAAFAISEIAGRRVDVRVVASLLFLTITAVAGKPLIVEIENGNIQPWVWLLLTILFASATLVVWQMGLICTENDARHRLVIGSVIIILIAFNAVLGLSSFRQEGPVNQKLTALRDEFSLNDYKDFNSTALIIQSETSFRLHLLLRSHFPDTEFQVVKHWDSLLTQATANRPEPALKRLIVNWNPQEKTTGSISIPGFETTEIILPHGTRTHLLRAYIVTPSAVFQQE
jgi:4-amino-4-deoxy-L-arabinose transferase-like glycosyltransferase